MSLSVFYPLVGYTITAIFKNAGDNGLRFSTKEGQDFIFHTEGDCCNDVFMYHMSGVKNLIGSMVLFVEDKDWVSVADTTTQEVEEASFYTIQSSNGYFDLEVRNSHNGYYGGTFMMWNPSHNWMEKWLEENPIDIPITEDF